MPTLITVPKNTTQSLNETFRSTTRKGKMKKAPNNLVISTWLAAIFAACTVGLCVLGALQYFERSQMEDDMKELCDELCGLNSISIAFNTTCKPLFGVLEVESCYS